MGDTLPPSKLLIITHCDSRVSDSDSVLYNDQVSSSKAILMNTIVAVKPISKKAKNRFANLMMSCEHCIVEQHKQDKLFLRSVVNKDQVFWVNVHKDQDWQLEM